MNVMWPEAQDDELIPVYPDDTLEDLQRSGLRLLQKKDGFRFGLDSVLLAAYAASLCRLPASRPLRAADLGAGCGAVSLLLSARLPGAAVVGLELDPASCDALRRNIRLNRLNGRLQAVQGDIRHLSMDRHFFAGRVF
jgi:tRNA1Val (adenine37-N6)-methyltransferase